MKECTLSKEQLQEIEQQINDLTLGKVKNRQIHYRTLSWKPDYEVVCEYVFTQYGICNAYITFDEEGKVHIHTNIAHEMLLTNEILLTDDYPKPKINRKDETLPLTVDNVKSMEVVLAEPIQNIVS